jgi:pimeloyl-ACP methyl ester carboxylesterase
VVAVREAVEFETSSGQVLRGVRLNSQGADGPDGGSILFVHDVGSDLDEFATLPESLAAVGFEVVAIDLPGHGLSDGDGFDSGQCHAIVAEIVSRLATRSVVGLVSSGRTATVGAALGAPHGVAAQLLLNPVLDQAIVADMPRAQAVRMVAHGDGVSLVGTETQKFFSYLIGQKILLFNAAMAVGPAAFGDDPTLLAHGELFFRRYLKLAN